ncbi:hypothetical protein AYO40_02310 [Planctomycetaceae bacterium SCGC AG-212-D15]|nr:hypothetical protein AYO40_02310 [Planctomycetaceae bacterium SCGC AG-212-D15]
MDGLNVLPNCLHLIHIHTERNTLTDLNIIECRPCKESLKLFLLPRHYVYRAMVVEHPSPTLGPSAPYLHRLFSTDV